MPRNMPLTRIIQKSIPTRYDPRVVVNPCEPDRVPHLPVEILYQIARALPQPKQIFNLAMADKDTWEYLQPALWECEVTYEARLAHKYGGGSSIRLEQHYKREIRGVGVTFDYLDLDSDSEFDSDSVIDSDSEDDDSEDEEDAASEGNNVTMPEKGTPCPCRICTRRIELEERVFEAPMPQDSEQFRVTGAMTALHWASIQGASALPVARKAIRAALAHHQPSYISGIDLIRRYYREREDDDPTMLVPVDLPPPLFLAVAHGNFALCVDLVYAGANLSLLRGQTRCGNRYRQEEGLREVRQRPMMSFKVHEGCVKAEFQDDANDADCVCNWHDDYFKFLGCQGVGHVAIDFGQTQILEFLLQNGLNVQQGFLSLVHYAVVRGNMAAVKAVLDYDPSLANSRAKDRTPLHFLPFMKEVAGGDVCDGPLREIVSFLLERGAVLDALGEGNDEYLSQGQTPLGSAIMIGICADQFWSVVPLNDLRIYTVLHAAQVLVSLGSDWNRMINPFGPGVVRDPDMLEAVLQMTILLEPREMYIYRCGRMTSSDRIVYREVRKAWGQICHTIIAQPSESLNWGNSADNRATFEAAITSGFVHMVEFAYKFWYKIGWHAVEAVGNLLLSTGITPDEETMQKWERILRTEFEGAPAPHMTMELVKELQATDGNESDWAFLLAGVSAGEPETDVFIPW